MKMTGDSRLSGNRPVRKLEEQDQYWSFPSYQEPDPSLFKEAR